MKEKIVFIVLLFLSNCNLNAQNIGINNPVPDASAVLDIVSNNKGLLVPRLTSLQRLTIPAPATGLLVFDTSLNAFFYFDGTIWIGLLSGVPGWRLTGNAGTNSATNFIGTTDAQDIAFRVNNIQKMKLFQKGRLELIGDSPDSSTIYIGKNAGLNNSGVSSIFVGKETGLNSSGSLNTMIGVRAGRANTTGYENVFVGFQAGLSNTVGRENTFIGRGAGQANTTANTNVFIGNAAGASNTVNGSNTMVGSDAGSASTGGSNSFFGNRSGSGNTTGGSNTYIGTDAAFFSTTGAGNTFVGKSSGAGNLTGGNISLFGINSNVTVANLTNATAIGANSRVGASNTIILGDTTPATRSRVGIGVTQTGLQVGGNNVKFEIGMQGAGEEAVVYRSSGAMTPSAIYARSFGTLSTPTSISNGAAIQRMIFQGYDGDSWEQMADIGVFADSVIHDEQVGSRITFATRAATASGTTEAMRINRNGFVGMGTTNPQQTLHVNGGFQFQNGTEGNGKILTSDINGVASWIPGPASTCWGLNGNAGTNANTNFIGTTDNQPLVFRVDGNILAGRIDQIHANVFLGAAAGRINYSPLSIGNCVAIGDSAGASFFHGFTNAKNTFIGAKSGKSLINANPDNTFVGGYSGINLTGGVGNCIFGVEAGGITGVTSATRSLLLGTRSKLGVQSLLNATAIGASAQVDSSNSMVLGSIAGVNGATSSVKVGIGTTIPLSRMDVNGSVGADIFIASSPITLDETNYTVIITGASVIVTLPAPATCLRRIYVLVNQTAASRTISSYSSFAGAAATTIPANSSITVQSNGASWYRIQ